MIYFILIALGTMVSTCATDEKGPPPIELSPLRDSEKPLYPSAIEMQLERLDAIAPVGSYRGNLIADIRAKLVEKINSTPPDEDSTPDGLETIAKDQSNQEPSKIYIQDLRSLRSWVERKCPKLSEDNISEDLPKVLRSIYDAELQACAGKVFESMALLEEILDNPAPGNVNEEVAQIYAADRLIKINKDRSNRQGVARIYRKFENLKIKPEKLHVEFQKNLLDFRKWLIDQTLWAARANALVGEYELASSYCQDALQQVSAVVKKNAKSKQFSPEPWANLQAEALQTLATRINFENGDLPKAVENLEAALTVKGINAEWRDRLLWLVGLYNFRLGSYEKSVNSWSAQLKSVRISAVTRSKLYFWLGRAYEKLGDLVNRDLMYAKVQQEDQTGYYAVVALPKQNQQPKLDWLTVFESTTDGSALNLVDRTRFDLTEVRSNKQIGTKLLRAEIAIAAEIDRPITKELVKELSRKIGSRNRAGISSKQWTKLRLYLSRLMFASGLYPQSFSITSDLIREDREFWKHWPDQIYVLFPRPFQDQYQEFSKMNDIDEKISYAISRQESLFDSAITSPANAIGLMQLIPHTARRFAAMLKMDDIEPIETKLKDPGLNIKLGTSYLGFLSRYYNAKLEVMISAYNAGEQAVDWWIAKRVNDDPLLWIEFIPFGETLTYTMSVLRNVALYGALAKGKYELAFQFDPQEETIGAKKIESSETGH